MSIWVAGCKCPTSSLMHLHSNIGLQWEKKKWRYINDRSDRTGDHSCPCSVSFLSHPRWDEKENPICSSFQSHTRILFWLQTPCCCIMQLYSAMLSQIQVRVERNWVQEMYTKYMHEFEYVHRWILIHGHLESTRTAWCARNQEE